MGAARWSVAVLSAALWAGAAVGQTAPVEASAAARSDASRGAPLQSLRPALPASNPAGLVPQVAAPPPGYVRVWADGRLNPLRGVPRVIAGPAILGGAAGLAAAYPDGVPGSPVTLR